MFKDYMWEVSDIKATIIYPASEKHIAKYSQQSIYLINETLEIYNKLTLPFLKNEQFSLQVNGMSCYCFIVNFFLLHSGFTIY